MLAQKTNIQQIYIFGSADEALAGGLNCQGQLIGTDNNRMEGLYQLPCGQPSDLQPTSQGIAYRSASDFLYGFRYDAARSATLALPAGANGAAFSKGQIHRYVLWAETTTDRKEIANVLYSFPSAFGITKITRRELDYATTGRTARIAPTDIALHAAPSFFQ